MPIGARRLLLGVSGETGPSYAPVQQTSNSGTLSSSLVLTLGTNVTAGDAVIIEVGTSSTDATVSSISGCGVIWYRATGIDQGTGLGDVEIWYGSDSSGGSGVATITFSGVCTNSANLTEWPDFELLDRTNAGTGNSPSTPSITPTRTNELVIAAGNTIVGTGIGSDPAPTNSYTNLTVSKVSGVYTLFAAYLIQPSGSTSTSWSGVGTGIAAWQGAIASFIINTTSASVSFLAALSFEGTLPKSTHRRVTSTITLIGKLAKRTIRKLSGKLTFVGNLVSKTVFSKAFAATLTFVGKVPKRTSRQLSSSLIFVGRLGRTTHRHLASVLTFVGKIAKRTSRTLHGTIFSYGPSFPLGVFVGDGAGGGQPGAPASVAAWGRTTNTNLSIAQAYLPWNAYTGSVYGWAYLTGYSTLSSWLSAWTSNNPYQMVITVPMVCYGGAGNTDPQNTLLQGAQNNATVIGYFTSIAENLVTMGLGNAILRPGWEFDADYAGAPPWSLTVDAVNGGYSDAAAAGYFATFFQNLVTAMNAVPGANFQYWWSLEGSFYGDAYTNVTPAWPGSNYVNGITADLYDQWFGGGFGFPGGIPGNTCTPAQSNDVWNEFLTATTGLNWLSSFAASVGVPFGLAECACTIRSDDYGLGDDYTFISNVYSWLTTNGADIFLYFAEPDSVSGPSYYDLTDGRFPSSLATFKSLFGGFGSAVGFLTKQTRIPHLATISFAGTLKKTAKRKISSVVTFSGKLAKQTRRRLSGSLTFISSLTARTVFSKAFSAVLTFSGHLTKRSNILFKASQSFIGNVTKRTSRHLSSNLTFLGPLTKRTYRILRGSLTLLGNLTKRTKRQISGRLTFVSNLNTGSTILKAFNAVMTFVGSLQKSTHRHLSGNLTFNGTIRRRLNRTFKALLTLSGNLAKQTRRRLSDSLTFVGTLISRSVFFRSFQATLTFVGTLRKSTLRRFVAALTFHGTIQRSVRKAVKSVLTFSGNLAKSTRRKLTGAITFIGTLTHHHLFSRIFTASVSFVGSLSKRTNRNLRSVLSFDGNLKRRTNKTLQSFLTFSGNISKRTKRTLRSSLTFAGSVSKRTARRLSSAITFVGSLYRNKLIKVLFTATLSFISKLNFTRGIGRFVQYTAGLPKTAWSAATATAAWSAGASKVAWDATESAVAWTAGRVKQFWQNNDVQ